MTLYELLQYERHIEDTLIAMLGAVCENVYRSRTSNTAQTPRLEVKAFSGEVFQRQQTPIAAAPGWIYSTFDGRIEITAKTNRTSAQKTDAHIELIGKVRSILQQFAVVAWQNAQTALLPILLIDIRDAGTDDAVADTDDIDATTLRYGILFSINPNAIPSNL